MKIRHFLAGLGAFVAMTTAEALFAQTSATPAAAPVAAEKLSYEVYEVQGSVSVGATGVDPKLKDGWREVKVGERLNAGLQIRTGLRSKVKLIARPAEPPTVILVLPGTLINIRELAFLKNSKGENTQHARVEMAYGEVRAGVAESETRSDMEIISPAATLSKRGTDIFSFEYSNGRFMMSLSEQGRGLVQAIQNMQTRGELMNSRTRFVTAGQFVTQKMARAIDSMQLDRKITVNGMYGAKGAELVNLLDDHGLSFLLPQGTNTANFLDSPGANGQVGKKPEWDSGEKKDPLSSLFLPPVQTRQNQNEGNFGVGGGIIPSIFGGSTSRGLFGKSQQCRTGNTQRECQMKIKTDTNRGFFGGLGKNVVKDKRK